MKKVIAVLPDKTYLITTAETAEKNNWYIAYRARVIKEGNDKQTPDVNDNLPKTGTIMKGLSGNIYKIIEVDPTHTCAKCKKSNSKNRIGKLWYCNADYSDLVITKPIKSIGNIPGRNETCPCGSGKKYKHCCMEKDRHSPRHYFNSKYIQNKTA
jgi:hypothetical protein